MYLYFQTLLGSQSHADNDSGCNSETFKKLGKFYVNFIFSNRRAFVIIFIYLSYTNESTDIKINIGLIIKTHLNAHLIV